VSMWRWTKANILCRVRLRSGAAYQCKHDAASCINKFKANIDQGEFSGAEQTSCGELCQQGLESVRAIA